MFCYRGFGLKIQSEIELPGFVPEEGTADVVVRLGPVERTAEKGSMQEEVGYNPLVGAFRIRRGCEIVVDPLPDANPEAVRVLVCGRIMAFLMRQRGWLPLHASGIEIAGDAVLFLGATGAGKSTTAAAFHARGHSVITDDVGAVRVGPAQQCLVRAAAPRVRLHDDARQVFHEAQPGGAFEWDKLSFDLAQGLLHDLLPVRRIYLLEYGEEIATERIAGPAAVEVLSTNSFVIRRRLDKEALEAHLRDCAAVAEALPVERLFRPRSLKKLPELVSWVENDLKTI